MEELLTRTEQALKKRASSQTEKGRSEPKPATPEEPRQSAEERLFERAQNSFDRGELEASSAILEELLQKNPSFEGGSELLTKVSDKIWEKGLPMSFEAKHNHTFGSCEGSLSLGADELRFESKDHAWVWNFDEVQDIKRDEPKDLVLETSEKDSLKLGKSKRYKFALAEPLADEDWSRYQNLVNVERPSEEATPP